MNTKVLTLVGCALIAGVSIAASVTGNNEAVVIQKSENASSTGFQFICLPVSGFNITGGAATTIALADVLPPTELPATATVTVEKQNGTAVAYDKQVKYVVTVVDGTNTWTKDGDISNASQNETPLNQTDVLWLWTPTGVTAPAIVFCGEKVTDTTIDPTENSISAWGNANTEGKTIKALYPNAVAGDQVFVTEGGKPDYMQYLYDGENWWISNSGSGWTEYADADLPLIPAGEAFYYYAVSRTSGDGQQ